MLVILKEFLRQQIITGRWMICHEEMEQALLEEADQEQEEVKAGVPEEGEDSQAVQV